MQEIIYSHEALNELEPIQGENQTYIGICQYDIDTDDSVIIRHVLINSAFINDDEVYTDKRIQSFAKPMNTEPYEEAVYVYSSDPDFNIKRVKTTLPIIFDIDDVLEMDSRQKLIKITGPILRDKRTYVAVATGIDYDTAVSQFEQALAKKDLTLIKADFEQLRIEAEPINVGSCIPFIQTYK